VGVAVVELTCLDPDERLPLDDPAKKRGKSHYFMETRNFEIVDILF
jgi:hypothetical protein